VLQNYGLSWGDIPETRTEEPPRITSVLLSPIGTRRRTPLPPKPNLLRQPWRQGRNYLYNRRPCRASTFNIL